MAEPDTSTPDYILMHRFGRKRLDCTKGPVRQNFSQIQAEAVDSYDPPFKALDFKELAALYHHLTTEQSSSPKCT